ncbi:MAG TPA: hypothetical protein VJQ53_04775 [Candidatus Eisenbacteria bacterium]|nr:hypothetical protein [Candidatus Eisenbacteria bacterium]
MKIRLYLDVWPHTKPTDYLLAYSHPGSKPSTCKRYALDIEVPDPREPDALIQSDQLAPRRREGTLSVEEA